MRGSISWQVMEIFKKSGIFKPGTSKYNDVENVREGIRSRGETATVQKISEETKLHSYSAAYDYKECWENFAKYARTQLGLKDLEKTTGEHIQAYLSSRIEDGIAYSTWKKEASQLGKFGNALAKFTGRAISFRDAINEIRPDAKDALVSIERDRGFIGPLDVVYELKNADMRLVALVQLEGGARCHEATLIEKSQLHGDGIIRLTRTREGAERDIRISPETYQMLSERLQNGAIKVKNTAYRAAVARAAKRVGETVTGTHDFCYNFAQNRYVELTRDGYFAEQAYYQISLEMGNHSLESALHYIR